jgi:cation diffusion facilitator family transporter
MEYLSGLAVASMVLVAGILLVKVSVERLLAPEPVIVENLFVILVPVVAIFIKLGLAFYSRGLNKIVRSATVKATMLDCLFDAVITLITLITLGVSQITTLPVDAIIGLVVSSLIIYNGFGLIKENVSLLLGNSLDSKIQRQIETIVSNYDEFAGIKSIILNDFGPINQIIVVELSPNSKLSVANIQKSANDLSLEFEKSFDYKIVVYWNSKK